MPPKPKKERPGLNLDQFFQPAAAGDDLDFLLGAPEETAQRATARGLPLRDIPTRAVAPDAEQVRRLPRPAALLELEAAGDRASAALLAALRELGESLRAHGQLQPAIVYPESDPDDPAITHRLLHGQRRWTAAVLVGVPTLWAVEIARPDEVSRLLRQVEENERRAGLVDMERAWALVGLRDALQREAGREVPWAAVEARLQLSEGRRHDLLRLLRFAPAGQEIILRYGWAEWSLRPLHQAVGAGLIDPDTATDMLRVLAEQPEVTAPAVAALIGSYLQEQQAAAARPAGDAAPTLGQGEGWAPDPSAIDPVSQRIARLREGLDRLRAQVRRDPRPERRGAWRAEAAQLQESLDALLDALGEE